MAIENPLSAKEICAIIRSCASARVSEFSLNTLSIKFSDDANEIAKKALSTSPKIEEKIGEQQMALFDSSINQKENSAPDEVNMDLLGLQLAVDDPTLWERLQIEGMLNAQP